MQRRQMNPSLPLRSVLAAIVVAFGTVLFTGDQLGAQESAILPIEIQQSEKPVGVGVLMPAPKHSTAKNRIAKRPTFWERFTSSVPEAANRLNPPKPPLTSDPGKMTPPSAIWTPPTVPKAAIVNPNVDSLPMSQKRTNSGWTQRGAASEEVSAAKPKQDLAIGSGLAPRDAGVESAKIEELGTAGKLEPATSVIRLLPVNSGDPKPLVDPISEPTPDSSGEQSVVTLRAPETNSPEVAAIDSASSEPQESRGDSSDPPMLESGNSTSPEIASADDAPIPLRDPQDVLAEADSTDTDSKPESNAEAIEVNEGPSVAVEDDRSMESEPESEPESDPLPSSRRNVVVRDVRINRDGSLVSDEKKEQVISSSEGSSEKEAASQQPTAQDMVAKQEESNQDLDTPATKEIIETVTRLDYTGYPSEPIELSSSVRQMKGAMNQCLKYYYRRPESANVRSNWGMLHSIMVWGADTPIIVGKSQYNAIAWIAGNNHCAGKPLLIQENGRMVATTGVGLQGHQAQFLAVLALCDVPLDYPLYVGNTQYTVEDLVKEEMLACRSGEELTFSLIGLSHYLDTETRWTNAQGETWDLPRLLREELSQPIVGSACGGTHRLMGFAHALRKRRIESREITGQWKRAEIYMDDFVQYVFKLQNRDGSMSTDWFEGREDNGNMDRKVQTTGHMVEWLLSVLPDTRLQDPRLVSAVRYLTNAMNRNRNNQWKIGPKGHALRSLAMYYERVYQEGSAWKSLVVATEDGLELR